MATPDVVPVGQAVPAATAGAEAGLSGRGDRAHQHRDARRPGGAGTFARRRAVPVRAHVLAR
jgi:hypothetical protein